jgi:DNA-binding phage protein
MARTAISHRRKGSIHGGALKPERSRFREYSPTEELLNTNKIGAGIMECLLSNDPEGAMEIIELYLDTVNRVEMSKKSQIPRSTLYHSLKHKNPTIKTLAKLMHASIVKRKE